MFQYPCKFTNSIRKFHHNLCSICSIEIIFQLFPLGTIISNQGMIYQFTPERFLITVMLNIIVMLNEVKHLYRFFADAQRVCSVTYGLYPSDLGRFLPQKCPRCAYKPSFCQENTTPRSKIAAKVSEVLPSTVSVFLWCHDARLFVVNLCVVAANWRNQPVFCHDA